MKLNRRIPSEPVVATFKLRRAEATIRVQERGLKAAATGRCNESAFTMVEIALSLAIIGFALVAILGVLPFGLTVQKENREETIINQDATIWMNAIRNGAQGYDDLTNYVIAITNFWTAYNANGIQGASDYDGYDKFGSRVTSASVPPAFSLARGQRIIGLLSTPKLSPAAAGGYYSNYVVAYVRSISGSAVEKFPQNNPQVLDDAFSYKMIVQVFPYVPYNPPFNDSSQAYANRTNVLNVLQTDSHDVRLLFRWPLLPNGNTGNNRQAFRALIGGQMLYTNDPFVFNQPLYFIQPPNYANTP